MTDIPMLSTRCAICGTEGNAVQIFAPRFDVSAFNTEIFSARRLPDRIHYRMVRCNTCGLVRSDPVADPEVLARLYADSVHTYDREIENLRLTYGKYIALLSRFGAKPGSLLEIGCGSGFVLEAALDTGYQDVWGVEPSADAAARANERVRGHIVVDIMRPGLFPPERFDTVCLFQVFDHLPDPRAVAEECWQVLKPGGLLLCFNHDVDAFSARMMGERSPIVDIEHTFLYSQQTAAALYKRCGFQVLHTGSAWNTLRLYYLLRLMPLPGALKRGLLGLLQATRLGDLRLSLPLGNLYLVAQKP